MNITRYDPTKNLFGWPRWLDEFEDEFPATVQQRGLRIHETDKNIIAEAVVAGVPVEQVEVNIEDGILKIRAQSTQDHKTPDVIKSSSYNYYYTAALSGGDWHKAEADIKDGVVTITIPKAESAKPKKITVKARNK